MRFTSTVAAVAVAMHAISGCSENPDAAPEPPARSAETSNSDEGLIAAQALFDVGQLEEALARLDTSNPRHEGLRMQIMEEQRRLAMVEQHDMWSVGPAKLGRSLKQSARICRRRGGSWLVLGEGTFACAEEGKSAVVRARDGAFVHLVGVYSRQYMTAQNPDLYEDEVRLLREAFGEPVKGEEGQWASLHWELPQERSAKIGRADDGSAILSSGVSTSSPVEQEAIASAHELAHGRGGSAAEQAQVKPDQQRASLQAAQSRQKRRTERATTPTTASAADARDVMARLVRILNKPHGFKDSCRGHFHETDDGLRLCRESNGDLFGYDPRDRVAVYFSRGTGVYNTLHYGHYGRRATGPGSFVEVGRYDALYAERSESGATLLKYRFH